MKRVDVNFLIKLNDSYGDDGHMVKDLYRYSWQRPKRTVMHQMLDDGLVTRTKAGGVWKWKITPKGRKFLCDIFRETNESDTL